MNTTALENNRLLKQKEHQNEMEAAEQKQKLEAKVN